LSAGVAMVQLYQFTMGALVPLIKKVIAITRHIAKPLKMDLLMVPLSLEKLIIGKHL